MNKSFQLCWVAIVRAASVALKTDGLIRIEGPGSNLIFLRLAGLDQQEV
jgi:hypothetical protein